MPPIYKIRDWDRHFENAESRKVKTLRWIATPNKHDGKGYRRVSRLRNAIEVFCAWNLILQVASKSHIRGVLADENGPLTAIDLADATGYPETIFLAAFEALTDPNVAWLERNENPGGNCISSGQNTVSSGQNGKIREILPISPGTSGQAGTEGEGRTGITGEGRGGEDMTGKGNNTPPPPPPTPKETIPPKKDELAAYMVQIGMPDESQRFLDYYESKGWMVGRTRMKSWKATCRTWKSNRQSATSNTPAVDHAAQRRADEKFSRFVQKHAGLGISLHGAEQREYEAWLPGHEATIAAKERDRR